jgi:phospholipid/cholesterol/gamma-HCH transport system substrate-binding protein
MPRTKVGEDFVTCAPFRDASRLAVGSPVMIAGVRIGDVTKLSVEGDHARVDMRLQNDTRVPNDAWVTKRAYSPFGDSYIEIIPAGTDTGAASTVMLRSGECFTKVAEGASTDRLLRTVANAMPKVDNGLDRIAEVGANGRKWVAGTLEDKTLDVESWLAEGHIEGRIRSADEALATLEKSTTGAAETVHEYVPRVASTLDRFTNGIITARKRMSEVKSDLHEGLQGARDGMNKVDQTIDDIGEVVASIDENRGDKGYRGTLGKLVNDPQLANDIDDATEALADGAASFDKFKNYLGLRAEWDVLSKQGRVFLVAEIRAHHDNMYLIEIERGPLGGYPADELTDAAGTSMYYRRMEIDDRIRFSAQYGKRFGWFQIRGGIKESAFGLGADALVGTGRLRLSADVYGGAFKTPRLKLTGAFEVFRNLYILGGIDDALNEGRDLNIRKGNTDVPTQFDTLRVGRDYFFGGMLTFTDVDLSMMLRVYGALLLGLL